MPSYRIELAARVIDDQAERLNAELLNEETTPALTAEIATQVEADSAADALIQALHWVIEQREGS